MKSTICPVPIDQIPIKEFEKLSNSIFFKWPIVSKFNFYRKLFYGWLILFPITIIILSASIQVINSPIKLFLSTSIWSLIAPLILIIRHLLSWSYIYKRLKSENIEYEESGWYDGQIWEKTIEMREKDILTAQHDLKPIIYILKESFFLTSSAFLIGILLLEIFPLNKI